MKDGSYTQFECVRILLANKKMVVNEVFLKKKKKSIEKESRGMTGRRN